MIIRVPFKTLIFCRDNRLLKEFAFFLFLKYKYKNSCVFNYSPKSLSEKTGYSITKINRMVKIFLEQGWCEYHEKNLVFKNISRKFKIFILKTEHNEKIILRNLYYQILKQKHDQCMYIVKKRHDLTHAKTLVDHKEAVKHSKTSKYIGVVNQQFILSAKGLSKIWNCSPSMGSTILRMLEKNLYVDVTRVRRVVARCCAKIASSIKEMGFYWCRGRLIQVAPNRLSLRIK